MKFLGVAKMTFVTLELYKRYFVCTPKSFYATKTLFIVILQTVRKNPNIGYYTSQHN